MLVFGVFLRESARTAAKSRTNLSTNSGKATKRLGRLAPNLGHMCKLINYGNGYTPNKLPLETQGGHLGGFRGGGVNNSNVWGSCPIGTNFDSRLRIHLGMDIYRLNTSLPSIPQVGLGEGLGCHKFKSGDAVKRLDRLAPN